MAPVTVGSFQPVSPVPPHTCDASPGQGTEQWTGHVADAAGWLARHRHCEPFTAITVAALVHFIEQRSSVSSEWPPEKTCSASTFVFEDTKAACSGGIQWR